ncbi:reverse transcriptase [Blumeria hordei DH14]|uniref:Reverse transcriptase n=1 Tax=Blumeria graminis f. sp. hordei (strain DH14) TaxID=546991 RepID=N1J9B3_BLUG1|nr:reverse transcriptase [Blumeria hordei DH14]
MKYRRHRSIGPLRLLQINVCRGASSHELALIFANEERFDIVLIQEPYIYTDRQRQITKFNPKCELDYKDLLLLEVIAPSGASLLVVNVYNSPVGSNNGGEAWQASSQTTSPLAEPFIKWMNRLKITLISESDMPTHTSGSVLDLAFASSPLILAGAESSIIPELDISSLKVSARRALGKGTGQPWWNNDCRNAAQAYWTTRRSSTDQNTINAGKMLLRAAVRGAKRKFFQDKIDQANTAVTGCGLVYLEPEFIRLRIGVVPILGKASTLLTKDMFGMVNWHRTVGSFRTPPLKDPTNPGAPPANTLQEKRDVLARNLVQNASEVADVASDVPSVGTASLTVPDLTPAETKDSVINSGNTVPARLIQSTLISTLGKGLERLIARRLSWIAIRHKKVTSQHFGAVPLRSATDLTTCLVHDIETALNSKLTASLLTLDVKGAFDGVLPGRLVLRLRGQGWPDNLVRWVASFTSNRAAKIRLDGSTGPEFDVSCGLPQGSPVSPILFILYLAPLLHMGSAKRRFGYADDIAFLHTSQLL